MIDQAKAKQLRDFVLENKERFSIAYDIWQDFQYGGFFRKLIIDFLDEIIYEVNKSLTDWIYKNNLKKRYAKWEGIIFYKPEWEINIKNNNLGIINVSLDFDNFEYYTVTKAYYGICQCTNRDEFQDEFRDELSEIIKLINKDEFGEGRSAPWWPWCNQIDDQHANWHEKDFLMKLIDKNERAEVRKYFSSKLVKLGKIIENKADEVIPNIKIKYITELSKLRS
jgi:hypothetical protein